MSRRGPCSSSLCKLSVFPMRVIDACFGPRRGPAVQSEGPPIFAFTQEVSMRMLRYLVQRVEISFLGLTRVGTLGCLLASVLQAASQQCSSSSYVRVGLAHRTTATGKLQVSITLSATLVRPRRRLSCALGGEELCSPHSLYNTTVSRASKRSARQSDVARLTKLVRRRVDARSR